MTRYLLLLLFFVMLTGRVLGLDVSLAPGLSTKNALLYVIAGFVLIESAVARNRKLELTGVIVPFALLFLYALSTWVLIVLLLAVPTYSPYETLLALKGTLLDHLLLLLIFYYGVTSFEDALWLVKGLIWGIIIVNVVTLLDTWDVPDLGLVIEHRTGRAAGIIGNPNDLGALLAFFLPFAVALFLGENGARRYLALIGVLATAVLLTMTISRGAIMGTIAGSLVAAIFLRRLIPGWVLLRAGLMTLILGFVAAALLVATGYGDLLTNRLQESAGGDSFARSSGRTGIWRNALEQMLASPWAFVTGFGWGAHSQSIGHRFSLHSTYITFLYDLGVIGLSLMTATLAGVLAAARAAVRALTRGVKAYVMALVFATLALMTAMVFNDMEIITLYTWATTGAVLRLSVAGQSVDSGQYSHHR